MLSRRQLLLATAAALLPGRAVIATTQADKGIAEGINWPIFENKMTALAAEQVAGSISQRALVNRGIQSMRQLDVGSAGFREAVEASYETGNRYWLWQRLLKQQNINGGILHISNRQLVQLHDHPGATGLLRIISGETEVWQFDRVLTGEKRSSETVQIEELVRVSHRILKPGDTAVLTPEKGNIHALRAVSNECSMLDFFIPPYQRSQRSWYEPLDDDWFNKDRVFCKKIPQHAYKQA